MYFENVGVGVGSFSIVAIANIIGFMCSYTINLLDIVPTYNNAMSVLSH